VYFRTKQMARHNQMCSGDVPEVATGADKLLRVDGSRTTALSAPHYAAQSLVRGLRVREGAGNIGIEYDDVAAVSEA